MCFPFLNLVVSFYKEGVSVAEPLYVSFDTPILKLPSSLNKVVIHGGWSQEDGFKPWWEWFDGFRHSERLGIYLKDVGGRAWAIIITETCDGALIEELDPLDRIVQSHADIDFEPWVPCVCLIPLRAPLEGVFMILKAFFKMIDVLLERCFLLVVGVFPGPDHDA